MSKYLILAVLNLPFVVFGYIKAVILYKSGSIQRLGLLIRVLFWTLLAIGLLFARSIFAYLINHHLTDSAPLSLADVLLTTGVFFCLFLALRLYAKVDGLERKITNLQEKLSIKLSEK